MSQSDRSRLEEGLRKYNLTIAEINEKGWKYCGGDENAGQTHLNYFVNIFGGDPESVYGDLPSECACGVGIKRHFFITNKTEDEMICIGSECIKKFIDKSGRTCEICHESHKNRKDNICNTCRAEKEKEEKKKKKIKLHGKERNCDSCGIYMFHRFPTCRSCYFRQKGTSWW
tara:strand:+ start:322 stop:837 length:516 start_codon:yes stop_codon:yes gene_type:complete